MIRWQGPPTTKKPAPAVFNITNGEKEMQNNHIMALALALCNAGRRVKVPAITGSQLKALLDYIRALK
ncbi:TPA: hypothetical protein MHL23_15955 [Klebsiella pneumoniae]|nr:hypothetical protein [Klebsiella pneumoniae]HBZ1580846.1 hypothetical protein [Klebsiella pneumoniae]HBZ3614285.1 hypothetical protein [Klebsiella pneumoniae]